MVGVVWYTRARYERLGGTLPIVKSHTSTYAGKDLLPRSAADLNLYKPLLINESHVPDSLLLSL